jgi:hypothetical protein
MSGWNKFFIFKSTFTIKSVMIKNTLIIALVFCFTNLYSQNLSQFKPGQIWPDNKGVHINAHGGGILFYNNTYYWFGEHKIEGKKGNNAYVGIHCYSSKDLYNWKDEGIALKAEEDPSSEIVKGCIMERPKVIYNKKTGKFVMWFHLEKPGQSYGWASSGLAVGDQVTGPYKYIRSYRPNKDQWPVNVLPIHKQPVPEKTLKANFSGASLWGNADTVNVLGRDFARGQDARDMTIFQDDNGKAYHIFSSEANSTIHVSELADDYLSYTGKYWRIFVGRFMEAPAVFKRNGKYYFIGSGCTGWAPNAARSAVADHLWGPWTELGNPCVGEDKELTFHSQSTFILPVVGKKDAYIYMGDRWTPDNAIDGRYVWLPVNFENEKIVLKWLDQWDLKYFDKN